jgi:hypothetical protein
MQHKHTFEVGQVWSYDTRKGEDNSTLQIIKVDNFEGKEPFIHIAIEGLDITIQNKKLTHVEHLPLAMKSVQESVTNLLKENTVISTLEGYNQWKAAFEAQNAGVFTITVKEVVDFIENSMK